MNYDDLARRIVAQRNTLPEDDFDGFSPHQMSIIVYSPFSDDCPVDMRTQIDTALLDQSPIFQIAKHLLKEMKDNEGIKLTSTGNLPPRIVNEIYARNYITDSAIEAGITKLNQEAKWDILHCSKIVLKLAKLARVYRGRLLLTKNTQALLQTDQYFELFLIFFTTFATQFNWAYNDTYEDEKIGQTGFLYLLYLIHKYGVEFRELSYYTTMYLKAFPAFKMREGFWFAGSSTAVLAIRFFERFAEWFGFVEIETREYFLNDAARLRRTKLLGELLRQQR